MDSIESLFALAKLETKPVKVEFQGITFDVNFIGATQKEAMVQACTSFQYNPEIKRREAKIDRTKVVAVFCEKAVSGWKGVTPRKLNSLIPLDINKVPADQRDAEIPFSQASLVSLVQNCPDVDSFLNVICQDITVFNPPELEEELGNSVPSPSGN